MRGSGAGAHHCTSVPGEKRSQRPTREAKGERRRAGHALWYESAQRRRPCKSANTSQSLQRPPRACCQLGEMLRAHTEARLSGHRARASDAHPSVHVRIRRGLREYEYFVEFIVVSVTSATPPWPSRRGLVTVRPNGSRFSPPRPRSAHPQPFFSGVPARCSWPAGRLGCPMGRYEVCT